jgi:hypothetical protein
MVSNSAEFANKTRKLVELKAKVMSKFNCDIEVNRDDEGTKLTGTRNLLSLSNGQMMNHNLLNMSNQINNGGQGELSLLSPHVCSFTLCPI